jgi:putative hemolysin
MVKKREPIRIVQNKKALYFVLILLVILIILVVCLMKLQKKENKTDNSGIANPASVYCVEQGGKLEIRTDVNGGQYGVCVKNGKECDEWKYYRNECVL